MPNWSHSLRARTFPKESLMRTLGFLFLLAGLIFLSRFPPLKVILLTGR
jgi:hypothetical protein